MLFNEKNTVPMILAEDPSEYEPLGSGDCLVEHHTYVDSNDDTKLILDHNLLDDTEDNITQQAFRVSYEPLNVCKDGWRRGGNRADDVIEIFHRGNEVICSSFSNKNVIRRFTVDFPILQTFYHTFKCEPVVVPNSDPVESIKQKINPKTSETKEEIRCLCIVGGDRIEVRSDDGQIMLAISLPFQVSRVYSIKYGLLLIRVPSDVEKNSPKRGEEPIIPLFYTMAHPLNEVLPVIISQSSGWRGHQGEARYACDVTMDALCAARKLEQSVCSITSSVDCSLAKTPASRAWYGREGLGESPFGTPIAPTRSSTTAVTGVNTNSNTDSSSMATHASSQLGLGATAGASSLSQTTSSSQQYASTNSPLVSSVSLGPTAVSSTPRGTEGSISGRTRSKLQSPSSHYSMPPSPAMSRLMGLSRLYATPSRLQASLLSPVPQSPIPIRDFTPILKPRGLTASHMQSQGHSSPAPSLISGLSGLADSTHFWAAEPLIPDVCLHAVWSESPKRLGQNVACEAASKAFISEDITGQKYLCYLMTDLKQLRCLKLNVSTMDGEEKVVAGALSLIQCIDACAIDGQKLMLVIDTSNKLMLYTGIKQVGEVHVSVGGLGSPQSQRFSAQEEFVTPRIMSSSRAPSDMGDSVLEMSVSPVCESQVMMTPTIAGVPGMFTTIQPCMDNKFILTLISGIQCLSRIKSAFFSNIASRFLCAINNSIPKEKAVNLFCLWFVHKHTSLTASGNEECSELAEVSDLLVFLMKQMGWSENFRLNGSSNDQPTTVGVTPKKAKTENEGSDSDWAALLNSQYHKDHRNDFPDFIVPDASTYGSLDVIGDVDMDAQVLSPEAPLFCQTAHIFTAMHLTLEEISLNRLVNQHIVKICREALYRIAVAFDWVSYVELYGQEDSSLLDMNVTCFAKKEDVKRVVLPKNMNVSFGMTINGWISHLLTATTNNCDENCFINSRSIPSYPLIKDYSEMSATVIACFGVLTDKITSVSDADKVFGRGWADKISFGIKLEAFFNENDRENPCNSLRKLVRELQLTEYRVRMLPNGIALCILDCLSRAERNEPWLFECGRPLWRRAARTFKDVAASEHAKKVAKKDADPALNGMECLDRSLNSVLRSRYANDLRVNDVINMLNSSKPPQITRSQAQGQTDEAFREAQENDLYDYCLRSTTQPYGRALATLKTVDPMVTEAIQIPELVTYGRAPPHDLKIELTHVELPGAGGARAFDWAHFHNGVAAGCMVMCNSTNQLSSTPWILNSMPKQIRGQQSLSPSDAGFVLGLGLNGHLEQMGMYNMHVCLVRGEQLSSIALLLGMAASKKTTCDLQVLKMLAAHLPFLFPPTLLQLQIDPLVQTAALVGVGLLYAGSGHQTLAEAVFKEMIKRPTADLDPWPEREAYAVACGITIGLITCGQGPSMQSSEGNGNSLTEKLVRCMHGGLKQDCQFDGDLQVLSDWLASAGLSTSSSLYDVSGVPKVSSSHVKEGDYINVHVCSPGATIALGLMFLKTNNHTVANELKAPETLSLLDTVRPDFLLLRTMCRYLILWDEVIPTKTWVESLVPNVVHSFIDKLVYNQNTDENHSPNDSGWWQDLVDMESVVQCYVYVTTGACAAMALRFAGSSNQQAFETILYYCRLLMEDNETPLKSQLDMAGKATITACLNTLLLCLAIVMAGTGNVDVLRIARHLRRHKSAHMQTPNANQCKYHGTCLAAHMTIGFLFLGGGRYSLSTNNLSIAVLICAIYPKFPMHMADNRHHLQVLRHLHVLAAEPRALITVDSDNYKETNATCTVTYSSSIHHGRVSVQLDAPLILPELKLIEKVCITDDKHWSVSFARNQKSWEVLQDMIQNHGELLVRKRSASKSGIMDGKKAEDLLWKHCVQNECVEAYPFIVDLNTRIFGQELSTTEVWNMRLIEEYCRYSNPTVNVFKNESIRAMRIEIERKLMLATSNDSVRKYLQIGVTHEAVYGNKLACAILYMNICNRVVWKELALRESRHMRSFIERSIKTGMSVRSLVFLHKLLREVNV